MPPLYCDTHTHLNDSAFDQDRAYVIAACRAAGVQTMVEVAFAPSNWNSVFEMAEKYPGFYCVCGVHPQDCGALDDKAFATLREHLSRENVLGMGEIGLDYAKGDFGPEQQRAAFARQLSLANEIKKPLVLHCRNPFDPKDGDAYADLFSILKDEWSPCGGKYAGVLHCFSGTYEDAARAVDMGLALGINGVIGYPKNTALREAVAKIGVDRLVLETDCPYLPPKSKRGKRNDPSNIPEICGDLATALGIASAAAAEKTYENSAALFGF